METLVVTPSEFFELLKQRKGVLRGVNHGSTDLEYISEIDGARLRFSDPLACKRGTRVGMTSEPVNYHVTNQS